jgi:hypothetical protein
LSSASFTCIVQELFRYHNLGGPVLSTISVVRPFAPLDFDGKIDIPLNFEALKCLF